MICDLLDNSIKKVFYNTFIYFKSNYVAEDRFEPPDYRSLSFLLKLMVIGGDVQFSFAVIFLQLSMQHCAKLRLIHTLEPFVPWFQPFIIFNRL